MIIDDEEDMEIPINGVKRTMIGGMQMKEDERGKRGECIMDSKLLLIENTYVRMN